MLTYNAIPCTRSKFWSDIPTLSHDWCLVFRSMPIETNGSDWYMRLLVNCRKMHLLPFAQLLASQWKLKWEFRIWMKFYSVRWPSLKFWSNLNSRESCIDRPEGMKSELRMLRMWQLLTITAIHLNGEGSLCDEFMMNGKPYSPLFYKGSQW